jgi:hypothetical protein
MAAHQELGKIGYIEADRRPNASLSVPSGLIICR